MSSTETITRPTVDTTPSDKLAHIVCLECHPPRTIPRFALCGFMLSEINVTPDMPICKECGACLERGGCPVHKENQ